MGWGRGSKAGVLDTGRGGVARQIFSSGAADFFQWEEEIFAVEKKFLSSARQIFCSTPLQRGREYGIIRTCDTS